MSPCPNDTFMFHGLIHGLVEAPPEFDAVVPEMLDIEELNQRAIGSEPLPVTKMSLPALGAVSDRYHVLDAGAALGRGVGPLVVRARGGFARSPVPLKVAVPGTLTTAFLLLRIFAERIGGGRRLHPVVMRFDQILDAVAQGRVDAGLIIHESRFTYQQHGLEMHEDLGACWEEDTGLPLPLGVIAARTDLGPGIADGVGAALRRSVELAFAQPDLSRPWIREHAQEMSDEVCDQHIGLYVNSFSVDLGDEGRAAVDAMLERGRAVGAWEGNG